MGAFWRSLGLLFGPLGGLLGDLWKFLGVSWATFGGFRSSTNGWHALSRWVLELLMSSVDLVLSFFLSFSSFLGSFFKTLGMSQLDTSLLIRIRRTSSLETWFLKPENLYFHCFWWMSQLKSPFFKIRKMSQWISALFSVAITMGISTFHMILDVFPP